MKKYKLRTSMAFNMIGAIIFLLVLFGVIVSVQGYLSFTKAFKKEYAVSTYHMADTATTLIRGDHLDAYLSGEEVAEYLITKTSLDAYCRTIHVSMIYVIQVDTSDYGRFVSIFNPINNSVDDTEYTEWELGHKRDTTNDEYRQKYRALYEQEARCETVYRIAPTDGQHPHVTTMVPVKNSTGKVVAILCMQRPISELNEARYPYVRNIAISTLLLSVFSAILIAFYLRRQFVEPVRIISGEAARFAKENKKGETIGAISRFDEISNLAGSIDKMETDMVTYIENLTAITAEKERISAELSLARTIQNNAVPHVFPAFPGRREFDVYASMTPAKAVGGDFYNFFLIDDDHLAMVIGDVSGKGIPASLFMMMTNKLISDRTRMGGTPAEILSYVNDNLCEDNQAEMFVTVWLGIVEISTGNVIAASAGHDDAAVYRSGGSFELMHTKHGFVAAGLPGVRYSDFEFRMGRGDKLFLYTDGVTEATDKNERLFTAERMMEALNENREGSPEEILKGVQKSVNEFVGDIPPFDDLTMLCMELKQDQ